MAQYREIQKSGEAQYVADRLPSIVSSNARAKKYSAPPSK